MTRSEPDTPPDDAGRRGNGGRPGDADPPPDERPRGASGMFTGGSLDDILRSMPADGERHYNPFVVPGSSSGLREAFSRRERTPYTGGRGRRRGGTGDDTDEPVLITSAQVSANDHHRNRVRQYTILMSFRIPALVLAAVVQIIWGNALISFGIVAASIPLPWVAVLLANARPRLDRRVRRAGADRPTLGPGTGPGPGATPPGRIIEA